MRCVLVTKKGLRKGPVRAGIEHHDKDLEAGPFRAKIEEDYTDVFFEKVYAHQIDPKTRGEYGQATIELKETAIPKIEAAFRLKGEREDGFRELGEKFRETVGFGNPTARGGHVHLSCRNQGVLMSIGW